jgi:hypothetical protein
MRDRMKKNTTIVGITMITTTNDLHLQTIITITTTTTIIITVPDIKFPFMVDVVVVVVDMTTTTMIVPFLVVIDFPHNRFPKQDKFNLLRRTWVRMKMEKFHLDHHSWKTTTIIESTDH